MQDEVVAPTGLRPFAHRLGRAEVRRARRTGDWIGNAFLGLAAIAVLQGTGAAAASHPAAEWAEEVMPGGPATLSALEAIPGGNLLAGTVEGHLFRSQDSGLTWTFAGQASTKAISGFAGSGSQVVAWTATSNWSLGIAQCVIRPSNCTLSSPNGMVLVSANGGIDWVDAGLSDVLDVTVTPDGAQWAATQRGVFRRPGAAGPFTLAPSRFPDLPYYSSKSGDRLAVFKGHFVTVFFGHLVAARIPAGASDSLLWEPIDGDTFEHGAPIERLIPDDSLLLGLTDRGILGLDSLNGRWREISVSQPPSAVRSRRGLLAGMADDLVLISRDGGRTWLQSGPAIPAPAEQTGVRYSACCLEILGETILATGTRGGLTAGALSGPSWRRMDRGLRGGRPYYFEFMGAWNGAWFAKTSIAGSMSVGYKERNGSTWQPLSFLDAQFTYGILAAGRDLFIGGWGLYHARQGLASDQWQKVSDKRGGTLVTDGRRVAASSGLSRTEDAYPPMDHSLLVADVDGTGLREIGLGALGTREAIMDPHYGFRGYRNPLRALAISGDTLIVLTDTLIRSLDGGSTWERMKGMESHVPALFSGPFLYAWNTDTTACRGACLEVSTDAASTWTRTGVRGLPGSKPLGLFRFTDGRLGAVTDSGVFLSDDPGLEWLRIPLPGPMRLIERAFADGMDLVLYTRDRSVLTLKTGTWVGIRREAVRRPAPRARNAAPGPARFLDPQGRIRGLDGRATGALR